MVRASRNEWLKAPALLIFSLTHAKPKFSTSASNENDSVTGCMTLLMKTTVSTDIVLSPYLKGRKTVFEFLDVGMLCSEALLVPVRSRSSRVLGCSVTHALLYY
jgi:hypothetical protein